MGDLNIIGQLAQLDIFARGKGMLTRHQKHIGKFRNGFGGQLFFVKQGAKIAVEGRLITDNAKIVVLINNIADGPHGVGLPVNDFDRRISGQPAGKCGKCVGNVACPRDADGKGFFIAFSVAV